MCEHGSMLLSMAPFQYTVTSHMILRQLLVFASP